jgi:hypothetical protein
VARPLLSGPFAEEAARACYYWPGERLLSREAPFEFTWGRWYNGFDDDGRPAKIPLRKRGFTYQDYAYGSDTPAEFLPPGGETVIQHALICSKTTFLLVIDVDYPENLPGSATGQLLSWTDAMSVRGTHFHIGVDMRGTGEADWPVQGRTAWGDIKSNGFVAAPGSLHYSGQQYAPTSATAAEKLVKATPELLAALEADKQALAAARHAQWGLSTGTGLPDGTYLYASGYTAGSWEQIPDGGLVHDDELKDLLWDMHVRYGREEAECRDQWFRLAGALSSPWTEKDFARHWRRVPARRLEELEKDDATRFYEDFGLRMPEPQWQAEEQRQQEEYQARQVPSGTGAAGFGPPPQVPPGGFEVPGVNYLPAWLGSGVFDAGEPTDADNALAVLNRAVSVLRLDEESDSWLLRDTGVWRVDDDAPQAVIMELRKLMPRGCADPVKVMGLDPETDGADISALKKQAKNYERLSAAGTVAAVTRLMKAVAVQYRQAGGTVRAGTLDSDPEILWAGGVPWDLRASLHGPVRAALDRNTPHLHSAGCVPDASAGTPLWDALMREVWVNRDGKPDQELASWALLVLSAGVTGYPKKVIPVLKGGTDRGKSTVIDALSDILGSYFRPLNPKVLDSGTSTHDTVLMELKGARLTFLDEGIKRGTMATTRLKRLAGGSSITANRMRQDPVTFKPTHTLVITLNPEDSFSFDDPAVDSRIRLLPCDGSPERVVAAARRFNYFKSPQWLAERPGVLAKLMQAAAWMLADDQALSKDRAPVTVQVAEQGVKDEEDDVLRWFLEATTDCPEGYGSRELFIAFREWTRETKGDRGFIPSETKWGLRMNELVPEDVAHRLVTPNKSRLRRRKPLQPGSYGPSGGFRPTTAAEFMGQSRGVAETISPVVIHRPGTEGSGPGTHSHQTGVGNPPEKANPPENPPGPFSQVSPLSKVSTVGTVGYNLTTTTENQTPKTHIETYDGKELGSTHRPPDPPPGPAAECQLAPGPGDPAAAVKSLPAETGENGKIRENGDSPPNQKNPRKRLTDEERAQRLAARKDKLACERADARRDKIAELGGPLVQLPAIVLRDQSILPCTPEQAAAWLEPMTAELSVDVEHSGYPAQHKDYALRLVQLGNEHSAVVLDPGDPEQAQVVRNALRAAQVLHAHSALADLIPLEAAGLGDKTMWDKMRDSVLLAKLSDPALCDSDEAGLKALAKALLGPDYALSWKAEQLKNAIFAAGGWLIECEVTTPLERSGWAQIPLCEAFVRYAAADVLDCSAVWAKLVERNQ